MLYRSGLTKRARRLLRFSRSLTATVNPKPVIVLGKEKSGTTAIAALLAMYTGCSFTRDIHALWGPAETKIRKGQLDFRDFVRRNRGSFARDIIKEPCLTFLYPQLREVFPRARFVMIVRDPRDNIRSVLNRLGLPGSLSELAPGTLAGITPNWRNVFDAEAHGLQPGSYIDVSAARWNAAADVYLQHKNDMVLSRYEDFVCRKVETIVQLAQSLQLPHVNDISNQINRQFQQPGDRAVRWADFFGERNLTAIDEICGSRMREFGYERVPTKACAQER
jgi:hypothetical protein